MIKINGNVINSIVTDGSSDVSIINGVVYVNGQKTDAVPSNNELHITIEGLVGNIKVDRGSITCHNVTGNVNSGSSVKCGNVGGSVQASGSVQCSSVEGNVSASGSVSAHDIKGKVSSGGSVSANRIG